MRGTLLQQGRAGTRPLPSYVLDVCVHWPLGGNGADESFARARSGGERSPRGSPLISTLRRRFLPNLTYCLSNPQHYSFN